MSEHLKSTNILQAQNHAKILSTNKNKMSNKTKMWNRFAVFCFRNVPLQKLLCSRRDESTIYTHKYTHTGLLVYKAFSKTRQTATVNWSSRYTSTEFSALTQHAFTNSRKKHFCSVPLWTTHILRNKQTYHTLLLVTEVVHALHN